jgi:glucan phosphoethanolaminetransferase (alkaline phosphatase superfamily)
MTVLSEDQIEKRCVVAAIALSCAHVLTHLGTEYQVYSPDHFRIDRFLITNSAVLLSPLVILFLFRRSRVAVSILAIPILIIFGLRTYYVSRYYFFGINSMARQKGDELNAFTLLYDMLSAGLAAFLLLTLLFAKLIEQLQRMRRR